MFVEMVALLIGTVMLYPLVMVSLFWDWRLPLPHCEAPVKYWVILLCVSIHWCIMITAGIWWLVNRKLIAAVNNTGLRLEQTILSHVQFKILNIYIVCLKLCYTTLNLNTLFVSIVEVTVEATVIIQIKKCIQVKLINFYQC